MAEISTFIKIDRNILEWEHYKDHKTKALFIHLLVKANYKDNKFNGIVIKRGQLVTSLIKLSEGTGLTIPEVRYHLKKLEKSQNIANKSYNKYRIITIINYNKWQAFSKQTANKPQQYKNNKKEKNKESKRKKIYNSVYDPKKATYNLKDYENKSLFNDPVISSDQEDPQDNL